MGGSSSVSALSVSARASGARWGVRASGRLCDSIAACGCSRVAVLRFRIQLALAVQARVQRIALWLHNMIEVSDYKSLLALDVSDLKPKLMAGNITNIKSVIEVINARDGVSIKSDGSKAKLIDVILQHISDSRSSSVRATVLQSELGEQPAVAAAKPGSMAAVSQKVLATSNATEQQTIAMMQAAKQHDAMQEQRESAASLAPVSFVQRASVSALDVGHSVASKAGGGGGHGSSSGGRGGLQHLGGSGGAEVAGGTSSGGLPLEAPLPHPKDQMDIDRSESVYQRFVMSSPQPTQRSLGAHSGLTPQVENTRQTVDDFLASAAPSLAALPDPPILLGSEADPTLKAILEGVNEIRANAVTKQTMQELYLLQRAEYQAFVQAETAPLHNAVGHIARDVVELQRGQVMDSDRIGRLETRLDSGAPASAGPNPNDIALRRVAFVGFPSESSVKERIAAMESFMSKHFADIRYGMVSLFPDNDGNDTVHGFVEVADRKVAKRVTSAVKSRSLKVDLFSGVVVKPAQTAIDRNRNWALRTADRLIRGHPAASGRWIETKRDKDRGIYVDGVKAFSQEPRYSKNGTFHGDFSGLKLPA